MDDTLCHLCGEHEDTIHQRIWRCQHPLVRKAREDIASQRIIKAALKAGPQSPLYNRGLFEHPAEWWPTAQEEPIHVLSCNDAVDPSGQKNQFSMKGRVATDGSCDQHPIKGLRRAGWACAELDDEGNIVSAAYGVVPPLSPP